jgi:hypothetical protein
MVTSRTKLALPGMTRLLLDDCLPPEEALKLLQGIKPNIDPEIGKQICSLCGYLPLALRAAGSLLAVTIDLDPADYLKLLRDECNRLENIGTEGVDVGIEASFNLSYARLDKDTAHVFRLLAVFNNWFDAEEEEFVCKDAGRKQLSNLLRHGLVLYDSTRKKYRFHDVMRLLANKKLIFDEERNFASARYQHLLLITDPDGERHADMIPGDYVRDEYFT